MAPELRIRTVDGVRGFFAEGRAIAANTTAIAVPRELLIGEDAAVEVGGLACVLSKFLRSSSLCDSDCLHAMGVKKRKQNDAKFRERMFQKTAVAVFLMERLFGPRDTSSSAELFKSTGCGMAPVKGKGRHDPYVKALPALGELGLLSLTLGWNEPCHGILNGTLVWQRSLNKRVAWAEQFDYLTHLGLFAGYSLEEFLHALALVKSRAFDVSLDGKLGQKQPAMVPFGDLMNMGPDPLAPPVIWHNHMMDLELGGRPQQPYLIFRTAAEVGVNMQLLTSYGAHHRTNSELIQNYGFTLEDWPSEAVPFPLSLPSKLDMREPKRDLLDLVVMGKSLTVHLRCDHSLEERFPMLLALARIAALTDADVHADSPASAAFRRAAGDSMLSRRDIELTWRPDRERLSRDHEVRSLLSLAKLMESDLLLNYPQAAAIDMPPSATDPRSFHRRQCVGYIGRTIRDGYGTVLDFCREALSTLSTEAFGQSDDAWQLAVPEDATDVLVPKARERPNRTSVPGAEPPNRTSVPGADEHIGRFDSRRSELKAAASTGYAWVDRFAPTESCRSLSARLVAAWRAQRLRT